MNPRPFERRCICPTKGRQPGEHEQACNDNHGVEFRAYVADFRRAFYAEKDGLL
jgi:hypothetical protein